MEAKGVHVCILARKKLGYNARIFKQAVSLAEAGYKVTIIALAEPGRPGYEETRHFHLYRVKVTPLHTRWRRFVKISGRTAARFVRRLKRPFRQSIKKSNIAWRKCNKKTRKLYNRKIRRIARKTCLHLLHITVCLAKILLPAETDKVILKVGRTLQQAFSAAIKRFFKGTICLSKLPALFFYIGWKKLESTVHSARLSVAEKGSKCLPRQAREFQRNILRHILSISDRIVRPLNNLVVEIDYFIKCLHITQYELDSVDVYHVHDSYPLLTAYILSRLQSARLVYDAVEYSLDRNVLRRQSIGWFRRMLEMHIVRKADAVITIGDELASLIARTYKIPKPYVIMNCPRYRRVLARNEQLLAAQLGLYSKRIVLYAGSITHNNGLEELIQAFDLLRDLDDVVGVLMGPITSRGFDKYLKALIERLGLRERVFILEPVRPEQVVTYAATAHVGVIPIQKNCLNHHYALPNKFFEYIMARLPIASSDLPNVRRLVEQYQIGVIFDERDPSSIASAIRRLLVDQTFYQQVKNNLNQIAEKFSWERQAEKLLRVYQTLGL